MAKTTVSITQLKTDIRIALGENENVEQLLSGDGIYDDQLQLERDGLIDSLILKGIDRVNTIAPLGMVADVSEAIELDWEYENYNDEPICTYAKLPVDFLRFVSAKLDTWRKTVYSPIDQDADEYGWQRSDFASIRASKNKPVVAIVPVDDAWNEGLKIELFPQNDEEDPAVRIIRKASINNGYVNVSKSTYHAVVYMIASLYYVTINETEKAKTMAVEAAEELGLTMENNK